MRSAEWMATLREWTVRLRGTFSSRNDREFEQELRLHLELAADDARSRTAGSPAGAARAAAIQFGGLTQAIEAMRDQRGLSWLRELAGDIRRALRRLRRHPGFAATAIVSLALGIGVNTALFTLANAMMIRSIGVKDPSRLVRLSTAAPERRFGSILPAAVAAIEQAGLFDGVCGFSTPADTVELNGPMTPVTGHLLTGGCFSTLGIRATVGRVLSPDDNQSGRPRVAVLSYDAWQNEFGATRSILDQTITIEGERFAIVGVSERGFNGLQMGARSPLYWPLRDPIDTATGPSPTLTMPLEVFARLRPGASIAEVTTHLNGIWPDVLKATVPTAFTGARRDEYLRGTLAVSDASKGVDYGLRRQFERPLLVLLAIAAIVLLVSSVNTANLLLARAAERQHEMLTRAALGASRWQLLKESLAESALLLTAGLGAAVLLAYWGATLLVAIYGRMMPLLVGFSLDVRPDRRILLFTLAVSAAAFVLFGIVPAWSVSRAGAVPLNAASPRIVGGTDRLRNAALVAQVALTIVLIAVGSLAIAALQQAKNTPLGLGLDRVIGAQLVAMPRGYQENFSGAPYYRDLLARLQSLPGVERSALSQPLPVTAGSSPVRVGTPDADLEIDAERMLVSDAFFAAVQIPIIAGGTFGSDDTPQGIRSAVVSESTARALFGSASPIGRLIRVGTNPLQQRVQVVGMARDVLFRGPRQQNTHAVYLNYWQADKMAQAYPSLIVRTANDPGSIADALDRTVRAGGHEYPVGVRSLVDVRNQSLAQEQLIAILAAAFAGLGLVLAAIGMYGMVSHSVSRRTAEIAIRMALGGDRRQIIRLIVGQAIGPVLWGAIAGVPAAWAVNRTVAALVYGGVSFGLIPTGLAVVVILLATVTALWLPLTRATRVDPLQALRAE